jgi:hypothetical protein
MIKEKIINPFEHNGQRQTSILALYYKPKVQDHSI